MRRSLSKMFISAALGLALAACGAPPAHESTMAINRPMPVRPDTDRETAALAAAPYCGITWGSGDKAAGALSTAPVFGVKTGRYACWDRVVFEFTESAKGYSVRYRSQIPTEGQGVDLVPYTAGGAFLWVTLLAPAYTATGSPSFSARTGDHVVNVLPYSTLRDVVYGGSFEGYTTFAVGVRTRLPFRVTLLSGPGTHSRIALDVAHRW